MRRAYSYLRFSEPRQQWGDSARRQAKAASEYCKRKDLFLDESLKADRGKSGYHGDNLATLQEFLARVGKTVPRGSVLIVENLDRLTREKMLTAFKLFTQILEAGIEVVTLAPERCYTLAAVNANIGLVMEIVLSLFLANEESRKKAERVTEEWRERLTNVAKEKVTARAPAWLELSPDRKTFKVKPKAGATIKQIVRWYLDGQGVFTIVRKLNGQKIPTIGGRPDSRTWHQSYVRKILTSRALIGEYQSYTGRGDAKKTYGEPIQDYFPRLVSDDDFYKIQGTLAGRTTHMRGRRGAGVANLFTGLLIDAKDGSPLRMTCRTKNKTKRFLVSSAAIDGRPGAKYVAFPYDLFESAVLTFLEEIKPSDIQAPDQGDDSEDVISALTGRLSDLTHKIKTTQAKADANPDVDEFLDMIADYSRQRKETAAQLDLTRQTQAATGAESVGEAQSLIKLLRGASGDELETLRSRLRAKLPDLVSEMICYFREAKMRGSRNRIVTGRIAAIQIHFMAGNPRTIFTATTTRRAANFAGLAADMDLREGTEWLDEICDSEDFGAEPETPVKMRRRDVAEKL